MKESTVELLLRVADNIKTGWELCDSKWQNKEAEVIALQTLKSSANNYKEEIGVFSWYGKALIYEENSRGLQKLLSDEAVSVSVYTGDEKPDKPNDIVQNDEGQYFIVRPKPKLILYAASHMEVE